MEPFKYCVSTFGGGEGGRANLLTLQMFARGVSVETLRLGRQLQVAKSKLNN